MEKAYFKHAELINKRRTWDDKMFTRDCLMGLRERNKNLIEKDSTDSADDDKGSIDIDDDNNYIKWYWIDDGKSSKPILVNKLWWDWVKISKNQE